MINEKYFKILDKEGFSKKTEAYETIRLWYSHVDAVTTCYDDGRWYIVQSKILASM